MCREDFDVVFRFDFLHGYYPEAGKNESPEITLGRPRRINRSHSIVANKFFELSFVCFEFENVPRLTATLKIILNNLAMTSHIRKRVSEAFFLRLWSAALKRDNDCY